MTAVQPMKSRLIILSALLAACSLDTTAPVTYLDGLPSQLAVDLTVEPENVAPHEPFTVTLTVVNTSSSAVQVTTPHSCLALPHVIRGGQRIPFNGTALGCFTVISSHTFAPGVVVTHTWELKADLYSQYPGDLDGAPAAKGDYIVQAQFDTSPVPATGRKPVIERLLRVR